MKNLKSKNKKEKKIIIWCNRNLWWWDAMGYFSGKNNKAITGRWQKRLTFLNIKNEKLFFAVSFTIEQRIHPIYTPQVECDTRSILMGSHRKYQNSLLKKLRE